MRKILIAFLAVLTVVTFAACKPESKTSSDTSSTTVKTREEDLFEVKGNSSEHELTSSQFDTLIKEQTNSTSEKSSTVNTNSESTDKKGTDSNTSSSGKSESTGKNSSAVSSDIIGTDKDGDGWTDGWN